MRNQTFRQAYSAQSDITMELIMKMDDLRLIVAVVLLRDF